ncbi:MAG: Hsp70 family protein [Urechidicola sp.]|nr:Hsp70 family protein [Urechidicola sp.]
MKVYFGIHISYTSASIARMIDGQPTIIKTNVLKDKIPLCVGFNKKGNLLVGDSAHNALRTSNLIDINFEKNTSANYYSGFLRTIGTDKTYYSSNTNQEYSSEQLLGFVIRALRSFVKDNDVKASVITVPNEFRLNQIEAIRKAGMLGGLEQVEIVQESIAASLAFDFGSDNKAGFELVFDFGSEYFNATLLKIEEGIISTIDSEGDSYLGGKNIDFAIVDEIILPYIQENYVIDSILEDDSKKQILRNAMKYYAEATKNELSFKDSYNLYKEDRCGIDDDGEEIEIDVTITQSDIERVLAPVFQKAINLSLSLLERNNLKGSSLGSLILVGGPTFSPVLRKILEEQICKPDTSVDPKTIIVKGAAIYASKINLESDALINPYKVQLEIGHEAITGETEEFVTIKILEDKTDGPIPDKVFAEIRRSDNAWTMANVKVDTVGEVFEIQLLELIKNDFEIALFDDNGNQLQCEPSTFSITHAIVDFFPTLPYNIGIEQKDNKTGNILFKTINGLEKNRSLPAVGVINGIRTEKEIRPGVETDCIKIPIYEGDFGSEGTRAILSNHVADIQINGENLPCLLPRHSDIDLTIKVDRSERISVLAYFPAIDFSMEIELYIISNKLSLVEVEDLLFELFENEKIESSVFQKHFDIIFEMKKENNPDLDMLNEIYKELKTLPNNV